MAETLGVGTVQLEVLPDTGKFGSALGSQMGTATTAGLAGVKAGASSATSSFTAMQKAAGMAGMGIGEMAEPVGLVKESVQGLKEKWGELPNATAKVATATVALGGAMTGVGALALKLGKPIEEAHVQLETALKNTGSSYEELGPKIQKTIDKMATFGHGTADTQTALSKLTTVTGDGNKALSEMGLVSEYAAYKHISLGAAADAVGKQLQGGSKMAKQLGIDMKATTAASTELAAAQKADDAALKGLITSQESTSAAEEKLATKYGMTKDVAAQLAAAHTAVNAARATGDPSKLADAEGNLGSILYKATAGLKMNQADTDTLSKARANLQDKSSILETADTRLAKAHDAVAASAKKGSVESQEMAKIHGLAEAQANTFTGRLEGLKTKIENVAGTMASKWGPELVKAGPLLMGLGAAGEAVAGIMSKFKTAQEAAAVATDAMSASEDAAAVSEAAAAAPILPIVIGIGLLIAAALLVWKNWGAIWGWMKDAVNDAWIVIKAVFNFIVTGLKDYIMVYIWLLKEAWSLAWQGIQDVVQGVWAFLQGAYNFIRDIFIYGIRAEIAGLQAIWQGAWTGIVATVQGVWAFLQGAYNFVKDVFVAGIKAEITGLKAVWDGIWLGITAIAGAFIGFIESIPGRAKAAFDGLVNMVKRLLSDIEAPFKAIGSLVDKLPFVGHSPSPMEMHARKTVEGINAAWRDLQGPVLPGGGMVPVATGTTNAQGAGGLSIASGAITLDLRGATVDRSTLPALQQTTEDQFRRLLGMLQSGTGVR